MKVIVAGGRDFCTYKHYDLLKEVCTRILSKCTNIEIVSGKARGADTLGENFANEMGYQIKEFPADWDQFGKGAGYIRNKQMADYADALIVFWDGKSRGTKNMIDIAKKKGIQIKIQQY